MELVKQYKCEEIEVIPVAIRTPGTTTKSHHIWLKQIDENYFPNSVKGWSVRNGKNVKL